MADCSYRGTGTAHLTQCAKRTGGRRRCNVSAAQTCSRNKINPSINRHCHQMQRQPQPGVQDKASDLANTTHTDSREKKARSSCHAMEQFFFHLARRRCLKPCKKKKAVSSAAESSCGVSQLKKKSGCRIFHHHRGQRLGTTLSGCSRGTHSTTTKVRNGRNGSASGLDRDGRRQIERGAELQTTVFGSALTFKRQKTAKREL